jgi:hypothetical protein
MQNPKVIDVLKELKKLKDADSRASVELAAKHAEEMIRELEIDLLRTKKRAGR